MCAMRDPYVAGVNSEAVLLAILVVAALMGLAFLGGLAVGLRL